MPRCGLMANKIRLTYRKLMERNKDLYVFQSAESIISWDMETMMPPKAVKLRSEQLALLSSVHHRMNTDPETGKLLRDITVNPEYDTLTEIEKRNVFLTKKTYDEQTKLPEELVKKIAKQQAIAVNTWKKAKATRNFNMFKPELEKLVFLSKKAAEILMQVKQTATPYDALIDMFEPRMTSNQITQIFNRLQKELTRLLKKCETAPKQPDPRVFQHQIPIETQRKISRALTETVGYDIASPKAGGRLDETEHPFTNGYYDDVRITTHYYPDNFTYSMFSVLHEAGHALYEQNLNQKWKYQPVGTPFSYGIHESQSRLMENVIGRSQEFWTYFLPELKKITSPSLDHLQLAQFVHAINEVKPSKIRTEADEVTYNLHVIIRFQIEKDLFADKIKISELPEIWNQKYKEYLGLKIDNDSEGVMQDTHWASGLYGYFPSYALGNIFSGQMLDEINKEVPEWHNHLAQGNMAGVKKWLRQNVYDYGNLYDPQDLIKKISGKELDVKPYLHYLQEKYSHLYEF
jgi:carboxypeptidase Taq